MIGCEEQPVLLVDVDTNHDQMTLISMSLTVIGMAIIIMDSFQYLSARAGISLL